MKTFSGFLFIALSLVAHSPHLHGAPASRDMKSRQNLMATVEEFLHLLSGLEKNEKEVISQGGGSGFVTDGCSQDFLTLNPQLQAIQAYKEDFDIQVSCRFHQGMLKPCTMISLKGIYPPYHHTYVNLCDFSDPLSGIDIGIPEGLCARGTNKRLQQGDSTEKTGSTLTRVVIPVGNTGKNLLGDIHYKASSSGGLAYLDVENFKRAYCESTDTSSVCQPLARCPR